MAESVTEKITLRYPANVNGIEYPAGISIEVPKDVASGLKSGDEARLQQELRRMETKQDNIVPVGIDPVTLRPFRN